MQLNTKTDLFLKANIRDVPDFPKPGIVFKDITTLTQNNEAFNIAINEMSQLCKPLQPSKIIGIESRGFIFAAAIAYKLNLGFVPIRKKGKLPAKVVQVEYQLEYGSDILEIHEDALASHDRVIIVDDVLATGGTMEAGVNLVNKVNAQCIAAMFLIELEFLNGRSKLTGLENIISLLTY